MKKKKRLNPVGVDAVVMTSFEPDGGNLYHPHHLQVTSGQFWRCAHGRTGYDKGMRWIGCPYCAEEDPEAYINWHES